MSLSNNLGPIVSGSAYLNTILLPHNNALKVAHLNCRSISPSNQSVKLDELKSILSNTTFDVFAVSETWLKENISDRAVDIPGYKLWRSDRDSSMRGGGVGIFVLKTFKHKVIFKASVPGCESLFLELCFGNVNILIGVVYLPRGDLDTFEQLHRDLFVKHSSIVIVGDFNSNLFNTAKSDIFRSLCMRCNMSIVHNSKPTHFDLANRSTSLLDLFLVSNASMITFSDQVQCPAVSDHALIFASLALSVERVEEYIEYRDYRNIEWDGIFLFLDQCDFSVFFNATDADTKCSFISNIFYSLYSFVPIAKRKLRIHDDVWMKSNNITLATSLRDLSYSVFQSDPTTENWGTYCKLRNKAKNVIRKQRRNHFSNRFWGLDSASFWRLLTRSGCVGNDEIVLDYDADVVNDFFVGNFGNSSEPDLGVFDDTINSFSFCCITELELAAAINKVRSKSIGIDGISIQFIKLVFPVISKYLLHLINFIITTSVFPMTWKVARVVPIPKSRVVHGPDDLRPISILPALSKVVEHLLKEQMFRATVTTIYSSQYAFRQGHNTTSLLLELTDSIRKNVNEDKLSVLVSLDLSKAFNSINFVKMIEKLKNYYNFSKTACKLILSYLNGRSQFVVLNGVESALRSLCSGVPQGSVLGPLLFILYINDLPHCTNSEFCKTLIFADDVFLLFNSNRIAADVFEMNINLTLNLILQWTSDNHLSVNSLKTKAIMFGPTNRFYLDMNISMGNTVIEFVDHLRCLGVVLDSKLCFKNHIDALCGRIWGSLRKMYSSNIFLPFRVKRRMAHAILMSQVIYGLEVTSGTTGALLTRLKYIVNTIVRFVYNVRRRDHISGHVKRFLGFSFENFVKYRNLLLFHRIVKSGRPSAICDAFSFSRSVRNPQILIERIQMLMYETSYLVRIARCWNRLPYELRVFSHSNNVFRVKLFNFFVEAVS